MFCRNCGKQLADEAKFCDACGTPTGDAPIAKAESAPNPMFKNFTDSFLGMFSENIVKVSVKEASSKTLEWILFAAAYSLAFALSLKIGLWDFNKPVFILSLLLGSLLIFSRIGGLFISSKFIFRKNTGFFEVANMTSYSYLPVAVVTLASILLSLIWAPLGIFSMLIAFTVRTVLCYAGFSKLDKFEKTPLFAYITGIAISLVMSGLFIYLFVLILNPAEYLVQMITKSIIGDIGMDDIMGGFMF